MLSRTAAAIERRTGSTFCRSFRILYSTGGPPLKSDETFLLLPQVYSIATQEKITTIDIQLLEEASFDFVRPYEEVCFFDPTSRTSNLHGVLHLAECVKNCPAWVYWQFTMEKACGDLVIWLQGKSRLDKHLANIVLLNEKMNIVRWANPSLALTWAEEIHGPKSDIPVGMLKSPLSSTPQFTDSALDAIAKIVGYGSSSVLDPRRYVVT
ncbi:hypothetical protein V1517DRAFT_266954 [Lipomyces orientalis]|uniref:Uncharacterized protein n=1 Tax=Lipomyces orientalis TaxID=1233043 RepID=A0ACC3TD15_9ASCO